MFMFLALLVYGFLNYAQSLRILARTEQHLILLTLESLDGVVIQDTLAADITAELPISLAPDMKSDSVYFTHRNTLKKVELSSKRTELLGTIFLSNDETPTALAYDWITNKLYFAFPAFGHENGWRLAICSPNDLLSCTVLVRDTGQYDVFGLALEPQNGHIYYSSKSLRRSDMDGENMVDLIRDATDPTVPFVLVAIHPRLRKLFYANVVGKTSKIFSCDMGAMITNCSLVVEIDPVVAFSISREYLIWTDSKGKLHGCPISNCSHEVGKIDFGTAIDTFVVIDEELQPNIPSPCDVDNGGCSYFCLLKPSSHTCACPLGVKRVGLKCDPRGVDKVMFVSTAHSISMISGETADLTPLTLFSRNDVRNRTKICCLNFDPLEKAVLWLDSGCVYKKRIQEDSATVLLCFPGEAREFKYDYISRNVYWLDNSSNRIYVTSIRSNETRLIISGKTSRIFTFDVDLNFYRIVFSTVLGDTKTIQICDMMGNNRSIVMNLNGVAFPLAVDGKNSVVYWSEMGNSTLKSRSLDQFDMSKPLASVQSGTFQSISVLDDELLALSGRRIVLIRTNCTDGFECMESEESSVFGPLNAILVRLNQDLTSSNPCREDNGGCQHICTVTQLGQRKCLCGRGFELALDETSCVSPKAYALLFFDNSFLGDVYRLSLNGKNDLIPLGLWSELEPPTAMDFDQETNHIFLASFTNVNGRIVRMSPLDSTPFVLLEGPSLVGISDISLDVISKNIYWTNFDAGRIEVIDKTGAYRRCIAWRGISPTHIVAIPTAGIIMFADQSDNNTIRSMPMYGDPDGGQEILGDLMEITDIAVDFKSNYLYWSEQFGSTTKLSRSLLDGSSRETLHVDKAATMPVSKISAYNSYIYYTNFRSRSFGVYDGHTFTTIHSGIPNAAGMVIAHGQIPADKNICYSDEEECPELCLVSFDDRNGTACYCRDNYLYDPLLRSCEPVDHVVLLGSERQFALLNVKKLNERHFSISQDPVNALTVPVHGKPVSAVIDPMQQLIFWLSKTDQRQNIHFASLKRPLYVSTFQGSGNCTSFYALSLDEVGHQLYASCRTINEYDSIVVFKMKNDPLSPLHYVGEVLNGGQNSMATGYPAQPRSLAVFPLLNFLFYVDQCPKLSQPVIVHCNLDGRECQDWYSKDLWSHTVLHADQVNLRLFYTCPTGVWSRDVGVSDQNVIHHWNKVSNDLAVAPIDEKQILIAEINTDRTRIIEVNSKALIDAPGQTVFMHRFGPSTPLSNFCKQSSCSHICRVVRDGKQKFECLCPLNFRLDTNNRSLCVEIKRPSCLDWQFTCDSGSQCIHFSKVCDGFHHCSDESDESPHFCANSDDFWPCEDRKSFISRGQVCDGSPDCADESDELHCRCISPLRQFDCGMNPISPTDVSARCIDRINLCNGIDDCGDNFDEHPRICRSDKTTTDSSTDNSHVLYGPFLFVIVIMLLLFCLFSCLRRKLPENQRREPIQPPSHYEGNALLSSENDPYHYQDQMALQPLRPLTVVDSSSTYMDLPPPNSTNSCSTGRSRCEYPPKTFYAPPPSMASLSTYGVVKPISGYTCLPKARSPIEYSDIEQTGDWTCGTISNLSQRQPVMSSTPKSKNEDALHDMSHRSSMSANSDPTKRRIGNRSKDKMSTLKRRTPSSSSLSSHSSDDLTKPR